MIDDSYRAASLDEIVSDRSPVQAQLELIGRVVEWAQFDKYLRWLRPNSRTKTNFEPFVMFKAMLLMHWHALTAPEYDYAIEKSYSFRQFIGLRPGEPGPRHLEVTGFRRLLIDRGLAIDVLSELHRQLSLHGILITGEEQSASELGAGLNKLYPLASDVRMERPPTWVSIEQGFLSHWTEFSENSDISNSFALSPENMPQEISDHHVVVKLRNNDFRFELVGQAVASACPDNLIDTPVIPDGNLTKVSNKFSKIQEEIFAVCRASVKRGRPIATSSYVIDDFGIKRNLWAVFAPIHDPVSGDADLIGAVLINRVEATDDQDWAAASAKLPLRPDEIVPFSLETSFRAFGPTEWTDIENAFLDYWNVRRGSRKAPSLADIKLSEISRLAPHLTLVRVLDNVGFQYELIGDHIQLANEGNATGQIIAAKREHNLKEYGHAGLQDELGAMFSRVIDELRPAGTSTYYVNSGGTRCQMWTTHAPLSDEYGEVCMIIGVTFIERVTLN